MQTIDLPSDLSVTEIPGDVTPNGQMTAAAVARRYGRSLQEIKTWTRAGVMPPPDDRGMWSISSLRAWEQLPAGVIGIPDQET